MRLSLKYKFETIISALLFLLPSFSYSFNCPAEIIQSYFLTTSGTGDDEGRWNEIEFCNYVEELANISKSISYFSPVVTKIHLKVSKVSIQAKFKEGGILYFPQNYKNHKGEFILEKKLANYLYAHEYGHALFKQYLKRELVFLETFYKNFEENDQKIIEADIAMEKILTMKASLTEEQMKIEFDKFINLYNEFKIGEDSFFTNNEMILLHEILSPYNELFADVIAILFSRNSHAMFEALKYPSMSEAETKMLSYRDFSISHGLEGWKESEAHSFFAPVRNYIWEHYLKNVIDESASTQRETVLKLLTTIKQEIQFYYHHTEKFGPYECNKSLIANLMKK